MIGNVSRSRRGRELSKTLERTYRNGDVLSNLTDGLADLLHFGYSPLMLRKALASAEMHFRTEREKPPGEAESLRAQAQRLLERADSFDAPVLLYEVDEADVGEAHPLGGKWLACDVGKRVYMTEGITQVENDDQLKGRTRK